MVVLVPVPEWAWAVPAAPGRAGRARCRRGRARAVLHHVARYSGADRAGGCSPRHCQAQIPGRRRERRGCGRRIGADGRQRAGRSAHRGVDAVRAADPVERRRGGEGAQAGMQAGVERRVAADQHDGAGPQLFDALLGGRGQRVRLRVENSAASGDGCVGSGNSHVGWAPPVGDHQRRGQVRRSGCCGIGAGGAGVAGHAGHRRSELSDTVGERRCEHHRAADELDLQGLPFADDALGRLGQAVGFSQQHCRVGSCRRQGSRNARVRGAAAVRHDERGGVRRHRLGGSVEAIGALDPPDRGAADQGDHLVVHGG